MVRLDGVIVALIVGLSTTSAAHAQETGIAGIDWKRGPWEHLSEHIGTYHYDAVLGDRQVLAAIERLLGNKKQELIERLAVYGPINFETGCLVLYGNKPHRGGVDMARLDVCLNTGRVRAAIMVNSKITVYASDPVHHLPNGFRFWIHGVNDLKHTGRLPSDVRHVVTPGE